MPDEARKLQSIEQISIMLVTNMKNKEPVQLTKDVIYHPTMKDMKSGVTLNKFPYITGELEYISSYFNTLNYAQRVRFFFDKRKFESEILNKMTSASIIDPNDANNTSTIYKNINKNVEIMIKCLFPTIFPVVKNYTDSYHRYILGESGAFWTETTFKNSIPSVFRFVSTYLDTYYSYVKIDGKVNTITKTVWLNDFFNHPKYRGILTENTNFETWRKKTKSTIKKDVDLINEKITKGLDKYYVASAQLLNNLTPVVPPVLVPLDILSKNIYKLFNPQTIPPFVAFVAAISNGPPIQLKTPYYINQKITSGLDDLCAKYEVNPGTSATILINNGFIKSFVEGVIEVFELYHKYKDSKSTNPQQPQTIADNLSALLSKIESVRGIRAETKSTHVPNSELTEQLRPIFDNAKNLINIDIIKTKYFGDEISVDFEDDSKDVKELFAAKYKKYVDYAATLKGFVEPERETTNENLQELIYASYKNKTEYDFKNPALIHIKRKILPPAAPPVAPPAAPVVDYEFDFNKFIDVIKKAYLYKAGLTDDNKTKNEDIETEFMHVDTTYIQDSTPDKPKYEIYLGVELIGGEINDSNQGDINCKYKGDYLGNMFYRAINKHGFNKYEYQPNGYFDIKTGSDANPDVEFQKIGQPTEEKKADQKDEPKAEPKPLRVDGGKRNNYKHMTRKQHVICKHNNYKHTTRKLNKHGKI